MRHPLGLAIGAGVVALALGVSACQPTEAPANEPATAADSAATQEPPATPTPPAAGAPAWALAVSDAQVSLSSGNPDGRPPFRLVCSVSGPTLTLSAPVDEVGIANLAAPFEMILAGTAFAAGRDPSETGVSFSVSAPLTDDILAAVRDGSTARISVNDGYAFAESAIDLGDEFERFAAACAERTALSLTP